MLLHRYQSKHLSGRARDRVLLANLRRDRIGFSLRLAHRDTGVLSCDHTPLPVVAIRYVIRNARANPDTRKLFDVHLRRKQQFKMRCQHTDDDRWWSKRRRDRQRLTDHRSIAAKALLKIFVTQNHKRRQLRWRISRRSIARLRGWGRRLRRAVRVLKVSTRDDRSAHHVKEICRNGGRADALRRTVQRGQSEAKGVNGSEIFIVI